jgi:filamentous hemagglutinin
VSGEKPFARAGCVRENCRSTTAGVSGASVWDEGGSNRTALHVVGGALMGGLGGGGIGTALQGAAGAGVSSAFAGKLNGLADQIGDATGSMTLGNLVSNVLAGAGGALVGGSVGAFTASNADLYNRSTGNGDGKGGTGNPFGMGKDQVSTVCGAGAQCSDATLNAAIQAQGANATLASQNMKTAAIYGAPAAAVIALGPEAVTAAALAGGLDYAGGAYSYATGLTKDAPSVMNSYIAGVVGGLTYPLAIGDAVIVGMGTAGKIAANAYNAGVTGVGAFGTAAMTGSNPDLSGGLAVGLAGTGTYAKAVLPGYLGAFANQLIQGMTGPLQNYIQSNQSSQKE